MNRTIISAAAILGCVLTVPAFASDHGMKHGGDSPHGGGHHGAMSAGVSVMTPWARATPGMAKNGGAYMTLQNGGKMADRLVAADADVAERVEIHTHINDNGVMRMRKIDGIDVPAGETVMLKPGGYHVMFIGLHKPLKEGESFPVTLTFEKGGKQTVTVEIKKVGAMKPGMGHGHSGHMGDQKKDGHGTGGHHH